MRSRCADSSIFERSTSSISNASISSFCFPTASTLARSSLIPQALALGAFAVHALAFALGGPAFGGGGAGYPPLPLPLPLLIALGGGSDVQRSLPSPLPSAAGARCCCKQRAHEE